MKISSPPAGGVLWFLPKNACGFCPCTFFAFLHYVHIAHIMAFERILVHSRLHLHFLHFARVCIWLHLHFLHFARVCIWLHLHFLHFARDCISLHYAFGGQLHFSCICFFCILCIRRETAFSCMDSLTHGLHSVCT